MIATTPEYSGVLRVVLLMRMSIMPFEPKRTTSALTNFSKANGLPVDTMQTMYIEFEITRMYGVKRCLLPHT
jgi:hypothetical protein